MIGILHTAFYEIFQIFFAIILLIRKQKDK